jgi:hypothetical protein
MLPLKKSKPYLMKLLFQLELKRVLGLPLLKEWGIADIKKLAVIL